MRIRIERNLQNRTVRYVFVLAAAVASSQSVNLALNQPTWQSTTGTYSSLGLNVTGYSWLAVDGNKNTSYYTGASCSNTQSGSSPWLVVDLGVPTYIYAVNLTSRGDSAGK